MNQPLQYDSEVAETLARVISETLGVPREQIDAYVRQRRAEHHRKLERHRNRWAHAIDQLSDVQVALVATHERNGYVLTKFLCDRHSGHFAPFMQKAHVWNDAKGRMGVRLLIIYPDGSSTTTMEKSISVRKEF